MLNLWFTGVFALLQLLLLLQRHLLGVPARHGISQPHNSDQIFRTGGFLTVAHIQSILREYGTGGAKDPRTRMLRLWTSLV